MRTSSTKNKRQKYDVTTYEVTKYEVTKYEVTKYTACGKTGRRPPGAYAGPGQDLHGGKDPPAPGAVCPAGPGGPLPAGHVRRSRSHDRRTLHRRGPGVCPRLCRHNRVADHADPDQPGGQLRHGRDDPAGPADRARPGGKGRGDHRRLHRPLRLHRCRLHRPVRARRRPHRPGHARPGGGLRPHHGLCPDLRGRHARDHRL